MTVPADGRDDVQPTGWEWFVNHIGRIAGVIMAIAVLGALIFLAVVGFRPALYFMLFFVIGVVLIAGGGKIHNRS